MSYVSQIVLFIGLFLMGMFMGSAVAMFVGAALGIDLEAISLNPQYMELNYLKGLQAIASLFAFGLPAVVFIIMQRERIGKYLKMDKMVPLLPFLFVPIMLLTIYPFLELLMQWNAAVKFPSFMSEFEQMLQYREEETALMTKVFLEMYHWGDLMLNLFVIAVIPAFVEEILFRGVLQNIIEKWTKNPHIAIWIAAAAFSAIHFQFYGFLGRWALGIWLGYLFYWSRSLWFPIIAHLLNNGILVLLIYFKLVEPPTYPAPSPETPLWGVLAATAVFIACAFGFKVLLENNQLKRTN